jgi:hypothetical protein
MAPTHRGGELVSVVTDHHRYSAAWPLSPLAAKHAGKVGEVNWNYRGFNSFRRALD